MKTQELNQDEQKNINGGSSLLGLDILDDLLGSSDDTESGDSQGSSSDNSTNRSSNSSSLPLLGDLGI